MLKALTIAIPTHATADPIGKSSLFWESIDKQKAIHNPTNSGPKALERPAPMLPMAFILPLNSAGTVLLVVTVIDEKKAD